MARLGFGHDLTWNIDRQRATCSRPVNHITAAMYHFDDGSSRVFHVRIDHTWSSSDVQKLCNGGLLNSTLRISEFHFTSDAYRTVLCISMPIIYIIDV